MEYLPKPKWHESFAGRRLDDELQLKKGIHSVTGATMTARATVAAAREVLAVHQALNEPAPGTRP
jgi:Na+-translocating ferredoxin:NAD+ oxidoreductase RnfG subunit